VVFDATTRRGLDSVEKLAEKGNQSYAILVESDQGGRPVSYIIFEQPQALQASASLNKNNIKARPGIAYERRCRRPD
jgi:hypothetical protein